MSAISRRRFLAISAAAGVATATGLPAKAAKLHHWRGVALGADASITLAHPEAARIVARARAEIARLERVFSLHRADSALVRLNAQGRLDSPPFELLECLGLCDSVNRATGGRFDPTVQPLWQLHAEHHARGRAPDAAALRATRARIGWDGVQVSSRAVQFTRPGMALTLNGVAQGYIADRVTALLESEGLRDVLVNTGEYRALGGHPEGGGWAMTLDDGTRLHQDKVMLRNRALASSAPLGTTFDADGQRGHILDPATGRPAQRRWRLISVTAPRAGLADALSTAMCLMTRPEIDATLAGFPAARLAHLAPETV